MRGGVGAGKAGAADHRVHGVVAGVGPEAAPQEFEHAPAAMARSDAGAADLEEPRARAARDELSDVEFARTVEAEIALGYLLPQQAIDADDLRRPVAAGRRPVDDEEMIADGVERAEVAAGQAPGGIGDRAALLEEDAIAQPLGAPDVPPRRRQTRFERAGARENRAEPAKVALAGEALDERARAVSRRPRCECQRHPASPRIALPLGQEQSHGPRTVL